jgi:hypothetical protein
MLFHPLFLLSFARMLSGLPRGGFTGVLSTPGAGKEPEFITKKPFKR